MHFKRTEIQNFKSIEKMSLNFSSGVNLLIGDNGVGKTTVLEALALSVQTYFSRMNDITKKGITQKDVRFTSSLVGDASQHRMYYTPTTIKSPVPPILTLLGKLVTFENIIGKASLFRL